MSECRFCSTTVPEGSRFCPSCGELLEVAARASTAPQAGIETQSMTTPSRHLRSNTTVVKGRFAAGSLLADRFRIVGEIGKGGMGEVYRADDLKLGESVALKFLPKRFADDASWRQRLRNEVRIARQVTHPNVCRVYDISESDEGHFISMEFIDGEDLSSLLRRIGRLPKDKAVEISRQLCAGLAAAHDKGVLHRDLKPANIMVDGRGKARVTDFGIAALSEESEEQEFLTGTPAYMAPEQLEGKKATVRSDIYALGLVLYEIFTGRPCIEADSLAEVRELHRSQTPTTPSTHLKEMDPTIERLIMRCLEEDPAARPQSAIAVAAALPGGDPLAMALEAGETPSPEMVAESGVAGSLRPPVALTCMASLVVGV
ncbi:MAG: protein kinase, partial [Planctomycetota bacterium]